MGFGVDLGSLWGRPRKHLDAMPGPGFTDREDPPREREHSDRPSR
jgi:hypothetical protein